MAKIKFTSKRGEKPSKLQRAGGEQRHSMIFYKGESIMSVTGNSSLCLYCTPKEHLLETQKLCRPQSSCKLGQRTRSRTVGEISVY